MERAEKCSCGNVASVGFGQDKSCKGLEYKWCVSCAECGKHTEFYNTKRDAIKRWNGMR